MIDTLFSPDWAEVLKQFYNSNKFSLLGQKIAQERNTSIVYPEKNEVFRAFELTKFNNTKVVILGQDPYHDGSADGLAFSASKNTHTCPPPLSIILNEINKSFGRDGTEVHSGKIDPWDLSRWAEQGVLLLNTSLTVIKGKPGSHVLYWKAFIKATILALNTKPNLVWLLMGNEAKQYIPLITNLTHGIVETYYPAEDFYSGISKFLGSYCFRQVDKELIIRNKREIRW